MCRFYFYIFVAWEFFPYIVFIYEIFEKKSKKRLFLQFLMNFYFVARLSIQPSRYILVCEKRESNPYGHFCPKDFPTTLAFAQANLTFKSLWSGVFHRHIGMLRNSNRIVISCIECLNVMPHGYFQLRCFLYVLYTIYDYDYTYDFM